MDDLITEFLTETSESLAVLDVELVKLEQNPNDPELLSNIFRLVHTIKGTCGFIGLPRLEKVAHAGENVLGKVRDGELAVTPEAVSLILECLDCVRSLTRALEETGAEPAGEDADLIKRLNAFADGDAGSAPAKAAPQPQPPAPVVPAKPAAGGTLYERIGAISLIDAVVEVFYRRVLADAELARFFADVNMDYLQAHQRAYFSKLTGGPDDYDGPEPAGVYKTLVANGLEARHLDAMAGHLKAALADLEVSEPMSAELFALLEGKRREIEAASAAEPAEPASEPAKAPAPQPVAAQPAAAKPADTDDGKKESAIAQQSIRVNVDLLESLMTTVSELVLTRNQVLQILRTQKDSAFAAPLQRLNHVTSELQEGVMKTRMQPIGNAWAKLPRLVRDLARELGKKIDLVMLGAETELDRQVLEMIKDPLTHMVRNSADHGLETIEDRRKAGKSETGRVTLNAYHEGGHIVIEISDDGRGLPADKIKAKVLQNGLASEADLAAMSLQQIQQFIFKAGFSTATKVTSVSGRGVGMDVVRTNIEKIGGTIELRSKEGQGTRFTIKIPLTLAIVSALIVECAGERFAVPQISVVELVRVGGSSSLKVERIKDTPVLRLRDRLLPLVSLRKLLALEPKGATEGTENFIVVAQIGASSFGIMVDRVFDTEEIVVKPVAPILRDISMFSGNTILGDGAVIMILDPNGIAAASGHSAATHRDVAESSIQAASRQGERVPLILFRVGDDTPKAVPLALVARLEELDCKTIERSNGRLVVQYRGQLMPLIPMRADQAIRESGRQPVLVFSDQQRAMGLIVDQIVDIVEDRLDIELSAEIPGRLGTAVVAGKATDIVDTGFYLTQAFADWFGDAKLGESDQPRRVLLVDDSPFFRNLMAPLLSAAGYKVTTAENADRALKYCEAGDDFDIILSDIEMPGMNGFEFAEAVKHGERWRNTPMVALSSRATPEYIARGRAVGFHDYVAKFDRDGLLQTLSTTLTEMRGAA
jgi:two-component system, chemotaxis family, sensor kinase CheA